MFNAQLETRIDELAGREETGEAISAKSIGKYHTIPSASNIWDGRCHIFYDW